MAHVPNTVPLTYFEIWAMQERARAGQPIPAEYLDRLLEERNRLEATNRYFLDLLGRAGLKPCEKCGRLDHITCFSFKKGPQETADDPPRRRKRKAKK